MKRLLSFLLPLSLLAVPAQVILIRNAETSPDSDTLSLRGRQRAVALSPFFQGTPAVLFHGLPVAIFAPDSGKETVSYLSNDLEVPVYEHLTEPRSIAKEIMTNPDFEGRMVLVCLPYDKMTDLAKQLGAKKTPKKWPQDTFDRFWTITFDEKDQVTFNNQPQKLLFGDSEK